MIVANRTMDEWVELEEKLPSCEEYIDVKYLNGSEEFNIRPHMADLMEVEFWRESLEIIMTHKTVLQETFSTGAQIWKCPICGRLVCWQWEPRVKSIVLEKGNEKVLHSGSTEDVVDLEADIVEPAEKKLLDELRGENESDESYL